MSRLSQSSFRRGLKNPATSPHDPIRPGFMQVELYAASGWTWLYPECNEKGKRFQTTGSVGDSGYDPVGLSRWWLLWGLFQV